MALTVTAESLRVALGLPAATTAVTESAAAAGNLLAFYLDGTDHDTHPECVAAALAVGVQIYKGRGAPGGQVAAGDMIGGVAVSNLLGPALLGRVRGMTGPCWSVGTMVG